MELGYKDIEFLDGGHVLLLCNEQPISSEIVAGIIGCGLKKEQTKDRCLVCCPLRKEQIHRALIRQGIEPEKEEKQGNLVFMKYCDAVHDGRFDADHLVTKLHSFIEESLAGNQPVRIVINVSSVIGGVYVSTKGERALRFERSVKELFNKPYTPVIGVCMHSIPMLTAEEIVNLLNIHPIAIIGKDIKVNPSHHIGSTVTAGGN